MQEVTAGRDPNEEYEYWNWLTIILQHDAKLSRVMMELQAKPREKAIRPKYTLTKAMSYVQDAMKDD